MGPTWALTLTPPELGLRAFLLLVCEGSEISAIASQDCLRPQWGGRCNTEHGPLTAKPRQFLLPLRQGIRTLKSGSWGLNLAVSDQRGLEGSLQAGHVRPECQVEKWGMRGTGGLRTLRAPGIR